MYVKPDEVVRRTPSAKFTDMSFSVDPKVVVTPVNFKVTGIIGPKEYCLGALAPTEFTSNPELLICSDRYGFEFMSLCNDKKCALAIPRTGFLRIMIEKIIKGGDGKAYTIFKGMWPYEMPCNIDSCSTVSVTTKSNASMSTKLRARFCISLVCERTNNRYAARGLIVDVPDVYLLAADLGNPLYWITALYPNVTQCSATPRKQEEFSRNNVEFNTKFWFTATESSDGKPTSEIPTRFVAENRDMVERDFDKMNTDGWATSIRKPTRTSSCPIRIPCAGYVRAELWKRLALCDEIGCVVRRSLRERYSVTSWTTSGWAKAVGVNYFELGRSTHDDIVYTFYVESLGDDAGGNVDVTQWIVDVKRPLVLLGNQDEPAFSPYSYMRAELDTEPLVAATADQPIVET